MAVKDVVAQDEATASLPTNSRPMTNAWARPLGAACSA